MNHWFLCGRDVMWFVLGTAPLLFSWAGAKRLTDFDDPILLFFSMFFQWCLIGALYFEVIR
jgi:hypothetical protein